MRYLFSFILAISYLLVIAQNPIHYVLGKEEFDGIELYSIIQDDDNSIWITSEKGLHHYNGIDYQFLIPEDAKNSSLFGLVKDNYGDIYCYNLSGQIYKIVDNQLKLYYTIPEKYVKSGIGIIFDNENNLLVRSRHLFLVISPQKKLVKVQENTGYFFIKKENTVYYTKMNLKTNKVQIIANKNSKEDLVIECNSQNPYRSIFMINDSFYGFNKSFPIFFKMENNLVTRYDFLFLTNRYFRVYDDHQNLWFSDYKNGVYKVPHANLESSSNAPKWFSDYYISGVMRDNEGNIWLLTFGKGIIIIPNSSVKTQLYKLDNRTIKGLSKTNNQLYVGTGNGEIYQWKNHTFSKHSTLKGALLKYFKIYKNDSLITTSSYTYENKKRIYELSFCRKSLLIDNIMYFAEVGGLSKNDLKKKKRMYLTFRRVYDVAYDKKLNEFWIVSDIGLSRHKNGKEVSVYCEGKPIPARKVINVNNEIWVAINKGIFIYKNDSLFKRLTVKDGLLSNELNNIKYEKPYVYISSQKGIQRYHVDNKTFQNITKSDGLVESISEFEVINDTVYALNTSGLLSFSFNGMDTSIQKYQTKIVQVLANGNKKITNNVVLSPDEKNIEFLFMTPTFRYQKEMTYQYQLIGFEEHPIQAKNNQKFVNYSNLPAGTYTFVVDSFIKDKKNKSASFTFTISRYWYQTIWFKLFVLVSVLLSLYFIYKTRINSILQKRDKEQLQKRLAESSLTSLKAQMNPHFLFNSMNSIQLLILEDQKVEAYEYLSRLSNLVRENLQMSDVSFVPFRREFELIKKYLDLEKLRFDDTLTYKIENDVQNKEVQIPSMIIQPFIENSIKHGLLHKKNNRFLQLQFKQHSGFITCIITDNGIGRKASLALQKKRKYQSFSTQAIQKRFDILREYYQIDIGFSYEDLYENNEPAGTRVTIKIPYNRS